MTDLEQFKYIEYYHQIFQKTECFNANSHNFILTKRHYDNSGGICKCINCNIEAHVFMPIPNVLVFDWTKPEDFIKIKLSCEEIVIKTLLE